MKGGQITSFLKNGENGTAFSFQNVCTVYLKQIKIFDFENLMHYFFFNRKLKTYKKSSCFEMFSQVFLPTCGSY